ncbi:MAG: hypothetical protein Q7S35_09015 [Candidatus Limnocylindrales bacterium]|nr:hypothetical protein [Candidatus Limnocylindrales bacterium]
MVATKSQGVFQSELARRELVVGGPAAPAAAVEAGRTLEATTPRSGAGRTGVVFVHGIGSQKPAETLLQWSAPLIEVLTTWHRHQPPIPGDARPRDPVLRAAIDFSSALPTIALDIPAASGPDGTILPAREWLLTEAWWASRVSPPSLTTIANWLGPRGAAGQVVDGILGNRSEGRLLTIARGALVPFVSVLSGVILTAYGLLRGVTALIPIQAVKDAAILREFDDFLTGWFGDVRILLFDPAQSANIRAGLAEAVTRLRDAGCDRIAVVAHSGGAMVSFLTLTDPAIDPERVRVDKLVTFGSGWNLALRLTPEGAGMADRLRRDITEHHPELRWRDFWGSHDPAPAGRLKLDEIGPSILDPSRIRSYRVWNRRSLLDDHGGYFDNDEEFVLPLLREIDAADGWGESSRFYPPDPASSPTATPAEAAEPADPDEDPRGIIDPRVMRHRQRVATVALWRQASLAIPVAAIALALQLVPGRLIAIGSEVAALVPRVPVVADLVDLARTFSIATLPSLTFGLPGIGQVPPQAVADSAVRLGTGVLQAIVLISALQIAAAPIQAYLAWPNRATVRRQILIVEIVLIGGMVVAVVAPLFSAADHGTLLGAGGRAWLPGIAVTLGTGALAWIGTNVARRIKAPAASSAFGAVASTIFWLALASSIVAIFRIPDLEQVELAYVAIWAGAIVVLRIGHGRWSVWDRAERQVAYGLIADVPVDRRPVTVSAAGFLLVGLVLAAWVLVGASAWIVSGISLGIALVLLGMALGVRAWRRYGDPTGSPGAVESARGSV